MNNPIRIEQALRYCLSTLSIKFPLEPAIRITDTRAEKPGGPDSIGRGTMYSHLKWMCQYALELLEEGRVEKANGYSSFVQGALWVMGLIAFWQAEDWNGATQAQPRSTEQQARDLFETWWNTGGQEAIKHQLQVCWQGAYLSGTTAAYLERSLKTPVTERFSCKERNLSASLREDTKAYDPSFAHALFLQLDDVLSTHHDGKCSVWTCQHCGKNFEGEVGLMPTPLTPCKAKKA